MRLHWVSRDSRAPLSGGVPSFTYDKHPKAERVTGTLRGRSGSFVLQHSGTMTRGAPGLSVHVVPDSGTGELLGLAGAMNIIIAGGSHTYEFEYSLGEP